MPEQQLQVQSGNPVQLMRSSLSALHHERQLAVIGKTAVVVHAGDLEWAKRDLAFLQIDFGVDSLRLKNRRGDGLYAHYLARCGIDRTEVDRLSQLEEAGCEQCGLAIGKSPAA